jgi:general secretion pathway protein G/type IV pilus assembly protein PilA
METKYILWALLLILGVVVALPLMTSVQRKEIDDFSADTDNLERLRLAITEYKQNEGTNPPSLEALVPDYIDRVPQTSDLRMFEYNAIGGIVSAPLVMTNTVPAANTPGKAGARKKPPKPSGGPLGEAMTGMSISEELNY